MVAFFAERPLAMEVYLAAEPTAPPHALDQLKAGADGWSTTLDTKPHRHALATRRSFRHDVEVLMEERDLDAIAYPISEGRPAR